MRRPLAKTDKETAVEELLHLLRCDGSGTLECAGRQAALIHPLPLPLIMDVHFLN
jgi:hypothetical protein